MSVIKITHAAAVLVVAACGVFAAQAPAFDVASIKPNTSNDGIQELQMRPGGRLMISGMPLRDLIKRAYGADAIQTLGQVVGGPAWAGIDRFNILAATDSDVDSDPQARPSRMLTMLRTLLEDRFKLHVHQETREAEAFALVVASKDAKKVPIFVGPLSTARSSSRARRVRPRIRSAGAASAVRGTACSPRKA